MINQGGEICVRIGRAFYRIPHNKTVPEVVEKFWKKNGQIDDLLKNGHLSEKQLPTDKEAASDKSKKTGEKKSVKTDIQPEKDIKEEKEIESVRSDKN